MQTIKNKTTRALWTMLGVFTLFTPALGQKQSSTQRGGTGHSLQLNLPPGQRLLYTVSYQSQASMDMNAMQQPGSEGNSGQSASPLPSMTINTSLKGNIEVISLKKTRGETLLQCRIHLLTSRIEANRQRAVGVSDLLKRDLNAPILFSLDQTGHGHALHFASACDALSQGVARTLLAQLQFTASPAEGVTFWKGQEEEPNGTFLSRYHFLKRGANGITIIYKTKIAPPPSPEVAAQRGLRQSVIPESDLKIVFDENRNVLQSVEGKETFVTLMGESRIGKSLNVISLRLDKQETLKPAVLASLQTTTLKMLSQTRPISFAEVPQITPQQEEQIQRNNLHGATWAELQNELARMENNAPDDTATQTMLVRLKACFYLEPGTCVSAQALLHTTRPNQITTMLLVEALRGAGHEGAQNVLLSVGRDHRTDAEFMLLLLPTLARLEKPVSGVDVFLQERSASENKEIASTATLTMGMLTRILAQASPQRAAILVKAMIQQLDRSESAERKTDWLFALGNAGQSSSLSVILRYSHHAVPEVRSAALYALNHVPSEVTEKRLVEAMTVDTESRVRLTAIRVAANYPFSISLRQALLKALQNDLTTEVRIATLTPLWRQGRALPEVQTALKNAAQQDISEEVRRAANSLLSQP